MEIQKELSSIAWNVPESVYREDPFLSYSTISRFEKDGYDGLGHLFDKIETPSLTLGSVVDTLITGSLEEFNQRFLVLDVKVTDGGIDTCNKLMEMSLPYAFFEEIPEETVSAAAKEAGFWKADKWDKVRYREVLKTGNIAEYYNAMRNDDGKTVISTDTYNDALNMVRALRESPATSGYFANDDPFSPVRRYYQLKFKAVCEEVGYRCMMDLLVVDYEKKIIYPCDLKTMGMSEWNFESNFMKFHYYIQARLYWRILRANLNNDPYFKDFKLEDFRFIVVNRASLTPLVWLFPLTGTVGTLISERGDEIKDPFDLGKELRGYLDLKPQVPNGINKDGVNIINCLKVKE